MGAISIGSGQQRLFEEARAAAKKALKAMEEVEG